MKNTNIRDLTIDQLGIVSGGNEIETQEDSENLFKLGLLDEAYGDDDLAFDWNRCSSNIDAAWAKVGITCFTNFVCINKYYFEGRKITRTEALEIAKNKMIKGPKIGIMLPIQ